MFWSKVEEIVGESVPMCVKQILSSCGYNNILSLQNISIETVNRIEKHVNEHSRDIAKDFDCCHKEFYKKQTVFKFLPGHFDLLIEFSRELAKHNIANESKVDRNCESLDLIQAVENHPSLSVILKEMIKTAIRNGVYGKNNAQYTDIIRYFATYIYIIGGRSCYEVLYKNLPLPSVSTVRKYER